METIPDLKRLYEQDFVAWCEAMVAQLKAGQAEAAIWQREASPQLGQKHWRQ